jgi:hypothetical protein
MKTWFMAAVMLAALPASAGNVWIALHDGTHELVTELGPEGPVTALTHAHTTLFGESSTQIALVSYDNATAQSLFRLIDKQTRQLLATWPVPTTPVALLSGAAPDIVLGPDTAYLLTHAGTLTPGSAYTRNARGGGFNVVRSALRTGDTQVLLRREQGKRILAFVDAAKLTVMWQRELPPGTSAWSMVAADADAVIYIDTEKAALMKTSRDGTAKLRELPASPRFSSAHVLSAGVP